MDTTQQLQQRLSQLTQLPQVLLVKDTTASTNDDVRLLAQQGIDSILVCSEQQTQGRGQRSRSWLSPRGNVYLSTLLNLDTVIDGRLALEIALNILQMPLLQGLALQVKWPNDLYSTKGKWGGILIEPLSAQQVIVGVGINVNSMAQHQLDQAATSLQQLGLEHAHWVDVAAQLYVAIEQAGQWFNHGCVNLAARFNHFAAFKDQQVCFEQLQGQRYGQFVGIQDDGAIVLADQEGHHACYQGRLFPL